MAAVITEADRKFMKKMLSDKIDQLQQQKQGIKRSVDNYVKSDFQASNLEQLYNKDADTYKADIDAQLIFVQAQIDKLQNDKQWLTEATTNIVP